MPPKLSSLRHFIKPQSGFKRFYSNGLPENLRRNYEKFQREDGVPVYLKGGATDRLLLGLTAVILAVGFVESVRSLLRLDRKK
ncbi:hypothetical protein TcasGA2_TC008031 [Tribolium castaneum]|uniref:Uncharacterized protein n=1 Tax=Tribolium castaneum TaxID=7070 RepID=D1ZZE9_TRICA|nr:PREDICTED: uncharacterized protein LOC103312657 [Tribolium castaneum]EFA02879.1 hypothetical protein TcasGA2_TC008031 [Tribolium castaneum]|eukprot:XP_008192058.1 PREDICTED: uncharacterized protein LOC103312657 [Tribolium castaneum]